VDESAQVTATTVVGAGPSPSMGQRLDAAEELIQLSRIVQDIHARTSQRHGLPPVQAKLLCVLAFGPRGMAELAKCFGVEKAALTGLVDRAERRGFVSRSPVTGDRRALRVTLTSSGRQAAAAFHADASAELNQLLSPLAPSDREDFRTALAKIITTRTQPPAPTQVGPPPPGGLQPSAQ
jgi:DNA-binding MarR family transcriptional regulator